jgi:hypothetical protein
MLDFDLDDSGTVLSSSLHGLHRDTAGEYALIASSERRLLDLRRSGGRLVTAGGGNDLAILRIGALRHRHFQLSAAATWLRDPNDAHDDVMEMLDPDRSARVEARRFIDRVAGRWLLPATTYPRPGSLVRAELAAIRTMLVYLHLKCEHQTTSTPLTSGVEMLAAMIASRAPMVPHLASILNSPLFAAHAAQPY